MTADEGGPDGPRAEDLLWSLGVGESLPEWLKDLRRKEREMGLNQEPRRSRSTVARPGIGPKQPWPGAEGSEAAAVREPAELQEERPAAEAQERRTDPDDGKAYTLERLREKYQGIYMEGEIDAYFRQDCKPLAAMPVAAPGGTVDVAPTGVAAAAPAPQAAAFRKEQPVAKRFDMSIKDWLLAMDDSGFLAQYHDALAARVDSLEQIMDVYVQASGEVDKRFFEDAGVKKLGHKRLFEKWFKDNCG